MSLRTLELFAGIGGLSRGLELGGDFHPVAFCERDLYARMILKKHWPEVIQYDDVCTLSGHTLARDGIGIDVVAGGWPCQPHSVAGKRENSEDDRDLWHEFARIIGETRPRWVVGENVPGVLSSHDAAAGRGAGGFFGRVLRDLATLGYCVRWDVLYASTFGAPNCRARVFMVAHSSRQGLEGWELPTPARQVQKNIAGRAFPVGASWPDAPEICGVGYGLPDWVDRLSVIGNAVNPQMAQWVGSQIMKAEERMSCSN